jgi:zinc dependent phospholipase C
MRRVLTILLLLCAGPSEAYSVLAHEAAIDAAWDGAITPLLRQRFPNVSASDLANARAYAYGGSLIQDLGYYPFGSHLFTNLTHYVRSGDFVGVLIRDARDVNEYAFALGALAHYACDNNGHPIATNRAVPMMYPKVRARVGDEALYVDDPARHLMVEFAYDVLRVAEGDYARETYRNRIGFEVSKTLLERATQDTYALKLGDVLLSVDLAIGSYRRAISQTIPEMTRIAWREKRDEIVKRTPGLFERDFVYTLPKGDYERAYGTEYWKPGLLSRFLAFIIKIVPKIGPFRALAFEPLTPEAAMLFEKSAEAARARYIASLTALRQGRADFLDTDFDTGRPPMRGENALADETYVELLHRLADAHFAGVTPDLRRALNEHFAMPIVVRRPGATKLDLEEQARVVRELAALNAT